MPAATTQATQNNSQAPTVSAADPDEFQFIAFAKGYVGLLATIVAIPLVSNVLNVIPSPAGGAKLNVIGSFLCLVIFGACFLLRGPLGYLIKNQKLRLLPFVFAVLLLVWGSLLVAFYVTYPHPGLLNGVFGHASWLRFVPRGMGATLVYLSIYPTFVFALGIVLVTSFTQQTSQNIQSLVEEKLPGERQKIFQYLSDYAAYREMAAQRASLCGAGDMVVCDLEQRMQFLSRGSIEMPGTETATLLESLLSHFPRSYDAVSYLDLDFWSGAEDPHVVRPYFQLNKQAVSEGTVVRRIFIFSDRELLVKKDDICKVLRQQDAAGIRWAVACAEELDPAIVLTEAPLDFGLFQDADAGCALTYFSGYRELRRRFRAVFDTPNNNKEILRQKQQYKAILSQCWIASLGFFQDNDPPLPGFALSGTQSPAEPLNAPAGKNAPGTTPVNTVQSKISVYRRQMLPWVERLAPPPAPSPMPASDSAETSLVRVKQVLRQIMPFVEQFAEPNTIGQSAPAQAAKGDSPINQAVRQILPWADKAPQIGDRLAEMVVNRLSCVKASLSSSTGFPALASLDCGEEPGDRIACQVECLVALRLASIAWNSSASASPTQQRSVVAAGASRQGSLGGDC